MRRKILFSEDKKNGEGKGGTSIREGKWNRRTQRQRPENAKISLDSARCDDVNEDGRL